MYDDEMQEPKPDTSAPRALPARARWASLFVVLLLAGGFGILLLLSFPPAAFPAGERIEIPFGTSLAESARILEVKGAVRSSLALQLILIAQFSEDGVKAGIYQFDQPLSVLEIARAITKGTHGIPLVRVTIPEGLRNAEIDEIVSRTLPGIAPGAFDTVAAGREGRLFPETYHVPETFTVEELVALMEETHEEKLAALSAAFDASTRSREDVVVMASILEREADSDESMQIVSDILWKRLNQGMPLQVDASFAYLFGKQSKDVTLDDLKTDSPYNTYKYQGLPPTPINNPGLQAIEAALSPTPSQYLYYLTAPDGTFHYARTFEEHKKNKALYLD